MGLDDIDFDDLVEICEGNEDTAELLQRLIAEHPADDYEDEEDRVCDIADAFANFMNGFWDEGACNAEGDPVDQTEHRQQNYDWGRELLESIEEWEE